MAAPKAPQSAHARRAIQRHSNLISIAHRDASEYQRRFELIATTPSRIVKPSDGRTFSLGELSGIGERALRARARQVLLYAADGLDSVQWRLWVDERVVNYLQTVSWSADIYPHEYTEALSLVDVEFGDALVDDITARTMPILDGFLRWRLKLCFDLIKANAVAGIDDQNLFDAAHDKFWGEPGEQYSNILPVTRVDVNKPTDSELRREFHGAISLLNRNRVSKEELHGDLQSEKAYVVITQDTETHTAYSDVKNEAQIIEVGAAGIAARSNRLAGKFQLLGVGDGQVAQPYFVIRADANGPRPIMWARWKDPAGLETRVPDAFDDLEEELLYGMRAWGGPSVSFPWTIVRVDPSQV